MQPKCNQSVAWRTRPVEQVEVVRFELGGDEDAPLLQQRRNHDEGETSNLHSADERRSSRKHLFRLHALLVIHHHRRERMKYCRPQSTISGRRPWMFIRAPESRGGCRIEPEDKWQDASEMQVAEWLDARRHVCYVSGPPKSKSPQP